MLARILVCIAALATMAAQAHAQHLPRTPDGHPDFHGVYETLWLTPRERPDAAPTVDIAPEELDRIRQAFLDREAGRLDGNLGTEGETAIASEIMRIGGVYRASQIIDPPDGRIPRTAAALARKAQADNFDDPEGLHRGTRCLTGTGIAPITTANFDMMRRVVQTAGYLVIYSESLNEARIIRLAPVDRANAPPSMAGLSSGRWDGDTLVVDTANYDPAAPPGGGARANPLSAEALVVERFSITTEGDLLYRYTVTDPVNYTQPWSGELLWKRSSQPVYETACHEGNYSLANILSGARMTEARKSKTKAKQ